MNLHGMNDIERNRQGGGSGNRNMPMMGGSNSEPSGDPRQETFVKFIRDFCCPTFFFKSFVFIISCVDLIIYIITLAYGIKLVPNELLAPKTETLDMFGMKVINIYNIHRTQLKCNKDKYGDS